MLIDEKSFSSPAQKDKKVEKIWKFELKDLRPIIGYESTVEFIGSGNFNRLFPNEISSCQMDASDSRWP